MAKRSEKSTHAAEYRKKSGAGQFQHRDSRTGQFLAADDASHARASSVVKERVPHSGKSAIPDSIKTGRRIEYSVKQRMREAGITNITPKNADEQFGILLDTMDRIARKAKETSDAMAENRKLIDAGLERIDRRADEIDRMLADLIRA
jgi:hypothetical protein